MKKLKKLIIRRMAYRELASFAAGGAGLLAFGSHAQAQEIGIQFQADGAGQAALSPSDTAGVVPQDNFNVFNSTNQSGGALVDNMGMGTGASLMNSYPVLYYTQNAFPAGGDQVLMSGGLNSSYQQLTKAVTLENIPYATYDVYVLGSSDNYSADHYSMFQLTPEAGYGSTQSLSLQVDTALSSYVQSSNDYDGTGLPPSDIPQANYVEFTGLTAPDFSLSFTGYNADGSRFNASLNGIEIVDVAAAPEPSSLALVASGALALGAFQLRRRKCNL